MTVIGSTTNVPSARNAQAAWALSNTVCGHSGAMPTRIVSLWWGRSPKVIQYVRSTTCSCPSRTYVPVMNDELVSLLAGFSHTPDTWKSTVSDRPTRWSSGFSVRYSQYTPSGTAHASAMNWGQTGFNTVPGAARARRRAPSSRVVTTSTNGTTTSTMRMITMPLGPAPTHSQKRVSTTISAIAKALSTFFASAQG